MARLHSVSHGLIKVHLPRASLTQTFSTPAFPSVYSGSTDTKANLSPASRRAYSEQTSPSQGKILELREPSILNTARTPTAPKRPLKHSKSPRIEWKLQVYLDLLVERVVSRGLLPVITATHSDSGWTVTISLDELAVEARGPKRASAEGAAATQFNSRLDSLDDFKSRLQTGPSIPKAESIVHRYCVIMDLGENPEVSHSDDPVAGYTVKLNFAGKHQESASASAKSAALRICRLIAAHKIMAGHPDYWPAEVENPFQPIITVNAMTVQALQQVADDANEILNDPRNGSSHHPREQVSKGTDKSYVSALTIPPSISKMLALGVILNGFDPAVIFAAMHSPSVISTLSTEPSTFAAGTDSDHLCWMKAFVDARKLFELPKVENPTGENQTGEKPIVKNSAKLPKFSKRYQPRTLQEISKAARDIEKSVISDGLLKPEGSVEEPYKVIPGTGIKLKTSPYSERPCRKSSTAVHLLLAGFGDQLMRHTTENLMSGTYAMHDGINRVQHDAVCKPSHVRSRLCVLGPLAICTGRNSDGGADLKTHYLTPISSLQAALWGSKVAVPASADGDRQAAGSEDYAELRINDRIDVSVKSEVDGLSHNEARLKILLTRELFHTAIDKCLVTLFNSGWRSHNLHKMFQSLPANKRVLLGVLERKRMAARRREWFMMNNMNMKGFVERRKKMMENSRAKREEEEVQLDQVGPTTSSGGGAPERRPDDPLTHYY